MRIRELHETVSNSRSLQKGLLVWVSTYGAILEENWLLFTSKLCSVKAKKMELFSYWIANTLKTVHLSSIANAVVTNAKLNQALSIWCKQQSSGWLKNIQASTLLNVWGKKEPFKIAWSPYSQLGKNGHISLVFYFAFCLFVIAHVSLLN